MWFQQMMFMLMAGGYTGMPAKLATVTPQPAAGASASGALSNPSAPARVAVSSASATATTTPTASGGAWTRLEWSGQGDGKTSTYSGGVYCGPGWGFVVQDVDSGKIAKLPDAIDAIDRACKRHDQCYNDHGYFTRSCNLRLAADLMNVIRDANSSSQMRGDAVVMAAVFTYEAVYHDWWLKPASDGYKSLKQSFDRMFIELNMHMQAVINYHINAARTGRGYY